MKKLSLLILALFFVVTGIIAQTPAMFKYQAVLRNADGTIIANQAKTVVINILQGSITSPSVFTETHTVTTTAQGIINLNIGSVNTSGLTTINWATNSYFIKITVDGVEMGTSQLMAVPYALFAKKAETADYNSLTNLPTLFNGTWTSLSGKPTTIAGYGITDAFDGSYTNLTNKPTLFSGNYADLAGKPTLFNGSFADLTNKPSTIAGYGITDAFDGSYTNLTNKPTLFSGNYADLAGKPTLFSGSFADLTNKPTTIAGYGITDAFDGSYTNLTNKPTLFSGNYADLAGKPTLFSGSFADLTNKPTTIAGYGITDAFNGTWTSLTGKPTTIAGYGITDAFNGTWTNLSGKPTTIAGYGITDAFNGTWASLSGKPTTIAASSITDAVTTNTIQNISGNKTFSGTVTVNTPVNTNDAANKAYVDVLKQQIKTLEDMLIETGGYKVKDIDGNVYNTVKIGDQVWTVENLKVTHYRNGDPIANVTTDITWGATTDGAYCWYNNDITHKTPYGALYNYYAIADPRNIAPAGWHVATYEEWNTLINNLGGINVAWSKVMEAGSNHWVGPNSSTNESGFTALPSGFYIYDDINGFDGIGLYSYYWSEGIDPLYVQPFYFGFGEGMVDTGDLQKTYGFAVRLVKD